MYREIGNEQTRQLIDTEQVFSAYRSVVHELSDRYHGTMNWRSVGTTDYLYRVRGRVAKSLGPRSPDTEAAHQAFHSGKAKLVEARKRLGTRLNEMAPVNRALQLGRMPRVAARIVRELGSHGLLGNSLFVVGTNALYAYERACGVQVESGYLATGDIDLLFDARRSLKLASAEVAERGLLGILRRVDATFDLAARGSYTAVNADGFMVDLIKPAARNRFTTEGHTALSGVDGDLTAVEIEGLSWLVNSRKLTQTVIDERGFPLDLVCPDPRNFALHKLWLSRLDDRDPAKRQRDAAQAALIAELVTARLPSMSFSDDETLSALPHRLRDLRDELLAAARRADPPGSEPDW